MAYKVMAYIVMAIGRIEKIRSLLDVCTRQHARTQHGAGHKNISISRRSGLDRGVEWGKKVRLGSRGSVGEG